MSPKGLNDVIFPEHMWKI